MTGLRELLLGRWRATAGPGRGVIESVEIVEIVETVETVETVESVETFGIRVTPRGAKAEGAWPSVECQVYACGEEDRQPGAAALGVVALETRSVELQLRVNKGILCVMSWTRFVRADPGQRAWVTRELFVRASPEVGP